MLRCIIVAPVTMTLYSINYLFMIYDCNVFDDLLTSITLWLSVITDVFVQETPVCINLFCLLSG